MQTRDFLIHLQMLQLGHGWLELQTEVFNVFINSVLLSRKNSFKKALIQVQIIVGI